MKAALFIPCYIDQFYPQAGISTLQLLRRLGLDVHYPAQQTCCGQPMANSGCEHDAVKVYQHFAETFSGYDHVIAPSGSCVYHIRKHYDTMAQTAEVQYLRSHTWELTEFLVDVLGITDVDASFHARVVLHPSCHGLRGLRLGPCSELNEQQPVRSTAGLLLRHVKGLELVEPQRPDECCGFGGTFSVFQEGLSVKMGVDRVRDFLATGARYVTAADSSCLMHLEGIIRRNKQPMKVIHIAEILNSNR